MVGFVWGCFHQQSAHQGLTQRFPKTGYEGAPQSMNAVSKLWQKHTLEFLLLAIPSCQEGFKTGP